MLDRFGSTKRSLKHRQAKAEKCYWVNVKAFKGPGGVSSKLRAWYSWPSTSSVYGACSWHLSKQVLTDLKRWEFRWLRRALRMRRRPAELQQVYHVRTSELIKKGLALCNVRLAHHRVLAAVFANAWREKRQDMPGCTNHLANQRNCRTRLWWEFEKCLSSQSRLKRSRQGPLPEWEDALTCVFGVEWRQLRDTCATIEEWKSKERFFINSVCELWDLPSLLEPTQAEQMEGPCADAKRTRKEFKSKLPPCHSLDGFDRDLPWQMSGRRCSFIVDCKPLQQVACGACLLLSSNLKCTFESITGNFAAILGKGWLPARAWDDPVIWKRRNENVIADYLANHTMNIRKSWFEVFDWPFEGHRVDECNLLVHSDGGTRCNRCSSAAWIVEVCVFQQGRWFRKPLAISGTYFDSPISSFTAECVALEECSIFIKQLLERGADHEPLGKRTKTA